MKTTKWFKTGAPIPDHAKYLTTEQKIVGYKDHPHPLGNAIPIREEFHLYEIRIKTKKLTPTPMPSAGQYSR